MAMVVKCKDLTRFLTVVDAIEKQNGIITKQFLNEFDFCIFVFGDNTLHRGCGGAAKLRNMSNAWGFVTKKYPNNKNESFYTPAEYKPIYEQQIETYRNYIIIYPDKIFLFSKLGSGLANKHHIFETVIEPNIKNDLSGFDNVIFLW